MKYRIKNLLVILSLLAIIIGGTAVVTRIMTIKQIERYYDELPYIWEEVDFAEAPWYLKNKDTFDQCLTFQDGIKLLQKENKSTLDSFSRLQGRRLNNKKDEVKINETNTNKV